jgi:hypothetical protein
MYIQREAISVKCDTDTINIGKISINQLVDKVITGILILIETVNQHLQGRV